MAQLFFPLKDLSSPFPSLSNFSDALKNFRSRPLSTKKVLSKKCSYAERKEDTGQKKERFLPEIAIWFNNFDAVLGMLSTSWTLA